MMKKTSHATRLGAATAALAVALVLSGAGPAMAAGGSGSRTCTAPKEIVGYSDQVGSGYHYFYANGTEYNTVQPAWQRGQFHSYTNLHNSSWLIYAPIVYSYGATCL